MTVQRLSAGWSSRLWGVTLGLALMLGCSTRRTDAAEQQQPASYAGHEGVGGGAGAAGAGAGGVDPMLDAGQSGAGAGTQDASTDTDAEAGTLDPDGVDYNALMTCSATACGSSYAQLNGGERDISSEESSCTMQGLRDRTPGLYMHSFASDDQRGLYNEVHLILVKNDQTALHVSKTEKSKEYYERTGTAGTTYTQAEICTLSPAGYFDGCLTAVQDVGTTIADDDPAWTCLAADLVDGWLAGCTLAEPSCE
ncbi:MAG: hypothetical protein JW940_26240 [Polyangiaceae bacterium]|nr:hypothetical protein [Polyangiaceae bacterium]